MPVPALSPAWMARDRSASAGPTRHVARPCLRARAVRPTRCRCSTTLDANSNSTTCETEGRSSPRAARPVDTSARNSPDWKRSRISRRSLTGMFLWNGAAETCSRSSSSSARSTPETVLAKTSVWASLASSSALNALASACSRDSPRSILTKVTSSLSRVRCSPGDCTHCASGKSWSIRTFTLRVPYAGTVAPTSTCCSGIPPASPAGSPSRSCLRNLSSRLSSRRSCSIGYFCRAPVLKLPASSASDSSSTAKRVRSIAAEASTRGEVPISTLHLAMSW
mmetsp:Transcript_6816/g.17870  ORF Transcript_6816/g.17870 Transcript_6816/m.17870 type:complete len:280 (+) Transcript_6816:239-1078(+)